MNIKSLLLLCTGSQVHEKKNCNGVSDWKFKKDFKPLDGLLAKSCLWLPEQCLGLFLLFFHYFFPTLLIYICALFHHPWNVSFFSLCFLFLRCHEVCFMRMHYEFKKNDMDKHLIFHALWLFEYQNENFALKRMAKKKKKKVFCSTFGLCFPIFGKRKKGIFFKWTFEYLNILFNSIFLFILRWKWSVYVRKPFTFFLSEPILKGIETKENR